MTHQHTTQSKTSENDRASQASTKAKPAAPAMHPMLLLQRQVGNQAVGRLIQAKLTVGEPNDVYEQEADRMADAVVSQIHAPQNVSTDQTASVQRQAIGNEGEELQTKPLIQRKSDLGGMAVSSEIESSIQQARGSGQPLAKSIRTPMEKAFGADFSGVRVHTDERSDRLNQTVQAKAFTTGQDIFFRQGEYSPGSRGGQELIAHELTHVVQQNSLVTGLKNISELKRTFNTNINEQITGSSNQIVQRTKLWSNNTHLELNPEVKVSNSYQLYYIPEEQDYVYISKDDLKNYPHELTPPIAEHSEALEFLKIGVIKLYQVTPLKNLGGIAQNGLLTSFSGKGGFTEIHGLVSKDKSIQKEREAMSKGKIHFGNARAANMYFSDFMTTQALKEFRAHELDKLKEEFDQQQRNKKEGEKKERWFNVEKEKKEQIENNPVLMEMRESLECKKVVLLVYEDMSEGEYYDVDPHTENQTPSYGPMSVRKCKNISPDKIYVLTNNGKIPIKVFFHILTNNGRIPIENFEEYSNNFEGGDTETLLDFEKNDEENKIKGDEFFAHLDKDEYEKFAKEKMRKNGLVQNEVTDWARSV